MLGRFQEDASGEYRWFTKSKTMLSWSRKGWRIQMESGGTCWQNASESTDPPREGWQYLNDMNEWVESTLTFEISKGRKRPLEKSESEEEVVAEENTADEASTSRPAHASTKELGGSAKVHKQKAMPKTEPGSASRTYRLCPHHRHRRRATSSSSSTAALAAPPTTSASHDRSEGAGTLRCSPSTRSAATWVVPWTTVLRQRWSVAAAGRWPREASDKRPRMAGQSVACSFIIG